MDWTDVAEQILLLGIAFGFTCILALRIHETWGRMTKRGEFKRASDSLEEDISRRPGKRKKGVFREEKYVKDQGGRVERPKSQEFSTFVAELIAERSAVINHLNLFMSQTRRERSVSVDITDSQARRKLLIDSGVAMTTFEIICGGKKPRLEEKWASESLKSEIANLGERMEKEVTSRPSGTLLEIPMDMWEIIKKRGGIPVPWGKKETDQYERLRRLRREKIVIHLASKHSQWEQFLEEILKFEKKSEKKMDQKEEKIDLAQLKRQSMEEAKEYEEKGISSQEKKMNKKKGMKKYLTQEEEEEAEEEDMGYTDNESEERNFMDTSTVVGEDKAPFGISENYRRSLDKAVREGIKTLMRNIEKIGIPLKLASGKEITSWCFPQAVVDERKFNGEKYTKTYEVKVYSYSGWYNQMVGFSFPYEAGERHRHLVLKLAKGENSKVCVLDWDRADFRALGSTTLKEIEADMTFIAQKIMRHVSKKPKWENPFGTNQAEKGKKGLDARKDNGRESEKESDGGRMSTDPHTDQQKFQLFLEYERFQQFRKMQAAQDTNMGNMGGNGGQNRGGWNPKGGKGNSRGYKKNY